MQSSCLCHVSCLHIGIRILDHLIVQFQCVPPTGWSLVRITRSCWPTIIGQSGYWLLASGAVLYYQTMYVFHGSDHRVLCGWQVVLLKEHYVDVVIGFLHERKGFWVTSCKVEICILMEQLVTDVDILGCLIDRPLEGVEVKWVRLVGGCLSGSCGCWGYPRCQPCFWNANGASSFALFSSSTAPCSESWLQRQAF